MKILINNQRVSWSIRVLLILVGLGLVSGVSFLEGAAYSNRHGAIALANDSCFIALCALRARHDPAQAKLETLTERELDFSGARLADMSLRYPTLIGRTHYNLLVRVRDYRQKYGRGPEADSDLDPAEVDRKIGRAIAYLESIHNTNDWFPFKSEGYEIIQKFHQRQSDSGR
jgi:hypothetical protein